MSLEDKDGVNVEKVMYRLLEYQSGGKADQVDTMIMVGLVNLLGIISVMNKQSPAAAAAPRSTGEDPLMATLLGMLSQGSAPLGAQGGVPGPPGINPALLMGLLGSRGQRPENALLMALLSSMMQQPPQHHHSPQQYQTPQPTPQGRRQPERERVERQPGGEGNDSVESGSENSPNEAGRQRRSLSWDRRLG